MAGLYHHSVVIDLTGQHGPVAVQHELLECDHIFIVVFRVARRRGSLVSQKSHFRVLFIMIVELTGVLKILLRSLINVALFSGPAVLLPPLVQGGVCVAVIACATCAAVSAKRWQAVTSCIVRWLL